MTECIDRIYGTCNRYASVVRYRSSHKEKCCAGYGGYKCNPLCSGDCNYRGSCVAPDVCDCRSWMDYMYMYTGNACQTPICNPACKFGSCTGPDICSCDQGYTGSQCDEPLCDPSCQNGGVCISQNTCGCPAGEYIGLRCDIPICNPPCLNGGTCSSSKQCMCPSSYQGRACERPVCKQPCLNGGTCVYPDICSCTETYTGLHCETALCSYHSPCFPGTCNDSVNCQCSEGFSGQDGIQRCKTMRGPLITRCTSILANIEKTGQKREKYRFMTDSSEPNSTRVDTLWVNQKDYNYMNVEFAAFDAEPDDLMLPNYVKQFKFGIVSGEIQINLHKVDRNDPNQAFVSQNETVKCIDQSNSLNPNEDLFQCNFTDENFDRLLENGDNLTITVIAKSGGFRELKEGPKSYIKDVFNGQKSKKSTMFRFDFEKPRLQNESLGSQAFDVIEDITKSPITFTWNNWMDDLSGLKGYKLQVYLLKLNTTYLSEPYPWNPLQEIAFNETESSYIYTPPKAGMFSFILNVIDKANNTRYARTLVLYDPSSSITLSTSPFIATSAEPETNYMWQNNLKNNITVSWKGRFENKFHDANKLLNQVAHYRNFDHLTKYVKEVPVELDDHKGKRTLCRIPNIKGIVKFEYFYSNENEGNNTSSSDTWELVDNTTSEIQTFFTERKDGDAISFWVRATDVMGNEKVDSTKIYFDSSPPEKLVDSDVQFTLNIKSATYAFSSRLQVNTTDRDSGIHKIHLELLAISSDRLFHKSDIPGNKTHVDVREYGYQVPMGDYYYYSHYIDINNCWMVVPKEKFAKELVLLNLTVYNNAMETTHYNRTITDLASFDGIDEYTGPRNLTVIATYDNSVRLKWIVSPSCYKRSKIILQFSSFSSQTETRFIDKDTDWVDLTGLDSETSYNLSFLTEYGDQRSDPVFLYFKTLKSPAALTTGAIAGTSIVFLILVGVIVTMVVLWRTGRLSVVRDDIRRRVSSARLSIAKRFSSNPDYLVHNNRIYDELELRNTDRWILLSSDIVFDALLTSGRFADLYKARYQKQNQKSKQIVIAKTLKNGYSEDDMLLMRAKMYFFGKDVGEQTNIIHFIGAVIGNDAIGPFMVFEYCTKGQLRDWLLQQRNESIEDIVESLYQIVYGISKGMFYLETKKIVHRRLSARNVLLTDELEPQIYGFGPETSKQLKSEEDGGGASEEKDRNPVKWTAPECFTSMKAASIKSDVWSFGIVLWEVFTLGETPYPGVRSRDVVTQVRNGYRMKRPEFANDFYYGLMKRCWSTYLNQRPSFKEISSQIGKACNAAPTNDFYYYCEK